MSFYMSAEEILEAAKDVQDAKQLSTPTLEENSTFTPGKAEGLGRWSEILTLRDTELRHGTQKNPDSKTEKLFIVKFEVAGAADGGCDKPNGGRIHTFVMYLNLEDKKDPKKKGWLSQRISKVNSLAAACGVDMDKGIDYDEYFNADKPLVGMKVIGFFNKYDKVNKRVTPNIVERELEETGFAPLEA